MRTRFLFSLAILIVIAGCYGRGSPDHQGFGESVDEGQLGEKTSFQNLKSLILDPYGCVRCHGEMASESGVRKYLVPGNPDGSDIYQRVKSGNMPQEGAKVPDGKVDYLRRYILELATTAPIVNTEPEKPVEPEVPVLEATYKSMNHYLYKESCFPCHSTGGRAVPLDTYDALKKNAADVIFQIELGEMPPARAKKPVPTAQVMKLFQEWIDNGFPQ